MPITKDQVTAAVELERELVKRLQPHPFDMAKAETRERREVALEVSKVRLASLEKILSEIQSG